MNRGHEAEPHGIRKGFYIKAGSARGGGGGGGGAKCGRWNPTAEQVKVLTDLFRSGLRTPSTDQIQKISNQLSFYGKIESKNVFYWFQNHKARERQKRRRVTVDDKDVKVSSAKHFSEMSRVMEPERVTETLQLFPVNSFEESEPEKVRLCAVKGKENMVYHRNPYCMTDVMDHPPLDLRLSFV